MLDRKEKVLHTKTILLVRNSLFFFWDGGKSKPELTFDMRGVNYLMKIANMTTEETKKTQIKIILAVNEFADVFPKDLFKLPPEREVEFLLKYILVRIRFLYFYIVWHQRS